MNIRETFFNCISHKYIFIIQIVITLLLSIGIVIEHIWISRQPFDDIDGCLLAHLMHIHFALRYVVHAHSHACNKCVEGWLFLFIRIVNIQIKFHHICTFTIRIEVFKGRYVRQTSYFGYDVIFSDAIFTWNVHYFIFCQLKMFIAFGHTEK